MTHAFDDIRRHLDAGDVPAAVRSLRPLADTAPPGALASAVRGLAEAVGFGDLRAAAEVVEREPGDARGLYEFGYLCIERGIAFLAVPALREALRLAPGALPVLHELVAALEDEDRHAEAAETLLRHEDLLEPWPGGYLLAYNSLLAGDLATARDRAARLPEPADSDWGWAHGRLRRMLGRAEAAAGAAPLDRTDLRGWQFALTGTLLGTLSPYGFEVMTGRYAYLADTYDGCRRGLDRLAIALDAVGRRPTAVSALPGRSDRILALAAADILALPVEPYAAGRPDTLVVAYDLSVHEPEVLDGLRERAPGQVLYEHAHAWTEPAAVPADFSALQRQLGSEPWGEQLRVDGRAPADTRPEADIARDVVTADPSAEQDDGEGPADQDAAFREFVAAVAPCWLEGPRTPVGSAGPVTSNRF
ncbi:hypothetical protein [Streptomyces sp. NPDC007369]|uniref:hypothetical protein n=1 Tax=Streptomyces sp. NPDC007369 TaxID=3154589 RepID=UPI0033E72662